MFTIPSHGWFMALLYPDYIVGCTTMKWEHHHHSAQRDSLPGEMAPLVPKKPAEVAGLSPNSESGFFSPSKNNTYPPVIKRGN